MANYVLSTWYFKNFKFSQTITSMLLRWRYVLKENLKKKKKHLAEHSVKYGTPYTCHNRRCIFYIPRNTSTTMTVAENETRNEIDPHVIPCDDNRRTTKWCHRNDNVPVACTSSKPAVDFHVKDFIL